MEYREFNSIVESQITGNCVKVFKNGPSKICGRVKFMSKQTISLPIFRKLSSKNFTWSILECLDPY